MELLKEQWAEGRFNSENQAVCTAANISAVTQYRLLEELVQIDADDLNEEEEERARGKEQLGLAPSRALRSAEGL
jgi:hypothetical protein